MRSGHHAMRLLLIVGLALGLGRPARAAESGGAALSLEAAVAAALGRDALVREARQTLNAARAGLVLARVHTPALEVSSSTSASSSGGLDPQSEVTGTDYSSQSYGSSVSVPMAGGASLGVSASSYTSTTNSALRAGGDESYTYAGTSASLSYSRPLGLFRDERAVTEGGRWGAELNVRQAELALEAARRDVVATTLTRFFAVLRGQQQVEIAGASVRESEELLRIAQEKLARGQLAEIEAMEAQVASRRAQVALRSAQSNAASAADALKSYLGRPLEEELEVAYAPTATPAGPGEEGALVTRALARRPDLQQLDLGLRQAALTLRMTEAETRPGLDLESGYGLSGEAESIAESWHKLSSPSWYVGLSTSLNLSHTESRTLVEQARARLRLDELDAQLTREAARLEIRELLRRVNDAAANAAVLEETRKLAEENLRIRQTQFEHGLIRPIDVAQTARELTETRYECLAAQIDLELARAQLQLAAGETPYRGGGVAS